MSFDDIISLFGLFVIGCFVSFFAIGFAQPKIVSASPYLGKLNRLPLWSIAIFPLILFPIRLFLFKEISWSLCLSTLIPVAVLSFFVERFLWSRIPEDEIKAMIDQLDEQRAAAKQERLQKASEGEFECKAGGDPIELRGAFCYLSGLQTQSLKPDDESNATLPNVHLKFEATSLRFNTECEFYSHKSVASMNSGMPTLLGAVAHTADIRKRKLNLPYTDIKECHLAPVKLVSGKMTHKHLFLFFNDPNYDGTTWLALDPLSDEEETMLVDWFKRKNISIIESTEAMLNYSVKSAF
jgi:hypothetical protein